MRYAQQQDNKRRFRLFRFAWAYPHSPLRGRRRSPCTAQGLHDGQHGKSAAQSHIRGEDTLQQNRIHTRGSLGASLTTHSIQPREREAGEVKMIIRARRCLKVVGSVLVILLLAVGIGAAQPVSIEEETMKRLTVIRAIKPEGDREATDRSNKQLDEAWEFFRANKPTVLPILRRELSEELRKGEANQMLLLDIGYFIRLQEDPSDKELGRLALFAIAPDAQIIRGNGDQLFRFAHAVATDREPRTLALLDKFFLRGNFTAFIPQHYLSLDETLVCVFLYGIFGEDAEKHLKTQLTDRSVARRVIEILAWIGSPDSVPEVTAAMTAGSDYDTLARGTTFMMTAGGPKGRAAILALTIESFDDKARQYYAKVRPKIEETTYETLQALFKDFPNPGAISDDEVKTRLEAMYKSYGKDDKTSPRTFLLSGLPKTYLITELSRIRARMFFRVSDEALHDVRVTNMLLNTLYYKQ